MSYVTTAVNPGASQNADTSSDMVLNTNLQRLGAVLTNDSDAAVYLCLAAAGAVVGQGVRLAANGGAWMCPPGYRGPVCMTAGVAGKKVLIAEW